MSTREEVRKAVAAEREEHLQAEENGGGESAATGPAQSGGSGYFDQLRQDFEDNHLGDARRFANRFNGSLLFDNTQGRWSRFDRTHWTEDRGRTHLHSLTEIAEDYRRQSLFYAKKIKETSESPEYKSSNKTEKNDLLRPLQQQKKSWEQRARELKDPTRINKVLSLASVCNPGFLGILGKEWNPDPKLFACGNAVIDLETGKQLDPDPMQFINRSTDVEWMHLNDECPLWEETFLPQVFNGDTELIDYVQKLVGYWLTGLMTHQEFYCLWGPQGRNGKGVFFRTIRRIMGSYFQTIPPKFLLDEKSLQATDKPDQILVTLEHTRLACASEAPKRAKFSEGAIKQLSGGDPITCRGMWAEHLTEYIPKFKMLFATNRVPSVSGDDKAFQERLRIIKFPCTFRMNAKPDPEAKVYPMNPQLEFELHTPEALSGVLAWAVRGAVEFLRTMDLTPPASVLEDTQDYMQDNDFVGEFIRECLVVTAADDGVTWHDGIRTQMKDVYKVFVEWCKREKSIPESKIWSQNALGKDFVNRTELVKVPPKNKTFYNVAVKNDWASLMDDGGL
ncbi:DNA primase family protein [Desulfovibrio oxyclinae]|uniref:DNA primase family protein n=1 Tax=Desulfovibrio oxyclinae TaxID=63560 RepID=UPI000361C585|nr:phage/plasmid primase, P4 family [Desulfovibrio oxyclinae]